MIIITTIDIYVTTLLCVCSCVFMCGVCLSVYVCVVSVCVRMCSVCAKEVRHDLSTWLLNVLIRHMCTLNIISHHCLIKPLGLLIILAGPSFASVLISLISSAIMIPLQHVVYHVLMFVYHQ